MLWSTGGSLRVKRPLRMSWVRAFIVASVFVGGPVWAQTSTAGLDLEKLKQSLRDELKAELKQEIKAELAEEAAATGAVKQDGWSEEEWKWEEPVKPELNFLDMDGYFRFRYQLFNKLDLRTYYYNTQTNTASGPYASGFSPPVPLCNTDVRSRASGSDANFDPGANSCANRAGNSDTLAGANMRLRLEPVFNVFEDAKIKMQVDVLDNLVLGSTPETFIGGGLGSNPFSPLSAFSQGQIPPSDGRNAIWTDSVRVKRVWAEVMTPLGQLRFGRMPSQFGLGVLANEGKGLDSNYGDSADRIMFATKIGDFYVVPGFDWAASGPTSAIRFEPQGQPFDRDQRDDVDQYLLAIARRDSEEDIKKKLANDETVFNYGTYQVGRFQALDSASFYADGDPEKGPTTDQLVERDAQAYIYSYWLKLIWRNLTIEAEYAGIIGKIGNGVISGPYGATDPEIKIHQHGAVVTAEYRLLNDALKLNLMVVAASGDKSPGWGLRPLSNVGGNRGAWDGSQIDTNDRGINNFRFDPDFQVDLIFWRQLVGMVTDALVVRPGIQYNITPAFGARLDLVYSRAWFANSTPSGSFYRENDQTVTLGNPSKHLGLEADAKLFYDSEAGFHAWLQYGIFVPFAGMDRQLVVEDTFVNATVNAAGQPIARLDAAVAHTIQLMFALSF